MYEMFLKYIKIDPELIYNKKSIIYNSIGKEFITNSYDPKYNKDYDFITIRNNLDGSKYCIDVVTRLASYNPDYKFCVVGKGDFFKYNKKPRNLIWIDKTLSHVEIIDFLNRSKYALMPTRTDAQGVMACEMATFGIPLITSDIEVCKEAFSNFDNVVYIDNEVIEVNLERLLEKINTKKIDKKNTKYLEENTIEKEIKLFHKLLS
jgi:glycosyltransferase involved in cell wall biosynthesis